MRKSCDLFSTTLLSAPPLFDTRFLFIPLAGLTNSLELSLPLPSESQWSVLSWAVMFEFVAFNLLSS